MEDVILKKRVGRTPVIRAKKLEKELGIGRIYLKLEGNNPSGHREDRLALLIIRDALSRGKDTICMGTYGTVGGSLSYLTNYFDIKCVFYVPSRRKTLRKDLMKSEHVEIREYGKTFEECVLESRRVAEREGWYDANPGLSNNMMNMYAFSYIARELNDQLDKEITDIYCQTSNGSSISGLHLGLRHLWINELIDQIPKIWAVTTSQGNAITESFHKDSRDIMTLDPKNIKETKWNRNTINWRSFNGQGALDAIYDSEGGAIGISDDELKEYAKRFRKKEKIKVTTPNAFPIAALMKRAEAGELKKGCHVVILNDGRVGIEVKVVSKEDLTVSYEEFLEKLDEWLIQFTDPMDEIKEAVENAFDKGYVICAFDGDTLVGIVILSRSKWERFFPHYHLSYIATKKDRKGMGIATQLMQKAIELSKGDMSLHVETDNSRAIKLYEKMGLNKKYYRMFYQGEGEP